MNGKFLRGKYGKRKFKGSFLGNIRKFVGRFFEANENFFGKYIAFYSLWEVFRKLMGNF